MSPKKEMVALLFWFSTAMPVVMFLMFAAGAVAIFMVRPLAGIGMLVIGTCFCGDWFLTTWDLNQPPRIENNQVVNWMNYHTLYLIQKIGLLGIVVGLVVMIFGSFWEPQNPLFRRMRGHGVAA